MSRSWAMGHFVRLVVALTLVLSAVVVAVFVPITLAHDRGFFAEGRVAGSGASLELFAPAAIPTVPCRAPPAHEGPWVAWSGASGVSLDGAQVLVGGVLVPLVPCAGVPSGLGERGLWIGGPPPGASAGRLIYEGGSARGEFRLLEVVWERGGTRALADALRGLLAGTGSLGPLCFVLLFVVATVLAFPATVLTVAGAVGFGLWPGFVLVWLGATLGAIAAFLVGRYVARAFVARHLPARLRAIDAQLEARGLGTVIVLRLLPIVPFLAVNYACGLSRMRLRDFALGTAVGTLPLLFLFVYAASAAVSLRWSDPATWLPLCAALPLFATPWLLRRVWRREAASGSEPRA